MEGQKMILKDTDALYQAIVNKDKKFEGKFYIAVKTTGIFCNPTCTAKIPKQENIVFYKTTKDALMDGYRSCKVCKPMSLSGKAPRDVKILLQEIAENPTIKFKDYDLVKRGISPDKVRKWFQDNHDLTFQDYIRIIRVNHRFGTTKIGDSKNGKKADKNTIVITKIPTPFGTMIAGASTQGICMLEFMDRRMLETQLNRLEKYSSSNLVSGISPFFAQLNTELQEYFGGSRKTFDVPLDIKGTQFQEIVWEALLAIPYGKTSSYQDQAIAINNPKAVRAVAKANGDNRIGIIIPCHRVIGKDGKMTGYGGKIWRKEYLLKLESKA
jgi:AraC family transcriptional regulator of adaptative response/methylated-DNA-[protein]-cysteine methyltransferase